MAFMPYLTRKTESFGVSIPEGIYASEEIRQMRNKYMIEAIIVTIMFTILPILVTLYMGEQIFSVGIFTIGVFVLIGVLFGLYLKYHFKMKKLKAEKNWLQDKPQAVVVDTAFRKGKITYSNLWFIVPGIIIIITIILTIVFFDQIPDKIPMQYDFSGNITNWADKSNVSVFMAPITQLFMLGLFIFINVMIARAKQQINPANPEKSLLQNQIFRRRWSGFTIVAGTLMILVFAVIQLSLFIQISPLILMVVNLGFTLIIVGYAIILSFTTGQGGSRINLNVGKEDEVIDRDDDQYWKLGQFYFNPDDPAIFIEKRFGIGWTVNFARPIAWISLLIILGVALSMSFIFRF